MASTHSVNGATALLERLARERRQCAVQLAAWSETLRSRNARCSLVVVCRQHGSEASIRRLDPHAS